MILKYAIYSILFALAPAGVLRLCRKVKWLGKIGPVLILYILGIFVGNLGLIPGFPASAKAPAPLLDALSTAMVPLAIPLMLFGCTFRKSDTRDQVAALLTGIISVTAAVVLGYLAFGRNLEEGAKIGGMLTGVYTGGTINMAALKTMLGVKEETFILLNAYDIIICFLYLTFLLSVGYKLFRKILPVKTLQDGTDEDFATEDNGNPYKGLFTRSGLKDAGILLGITLLMCGVSAGVALLVPDGAFMVVFILVLTSLGLAGSFVKDIHSRKYGYDIGMYFIYIFSMVVASMADFSSIDFAGSFNMLGYLTCVVFGSLLLQVMLACIFHIDSDTMVVSSVAFINSPPFVPMVAGAMRNRRVLISGLSIGIVGYAVGNYLGFLLYRLLLIL